MTDEEIAIVFFNSLKESTRLQLLQKPKDTRLLIALASIELAITSIAKLPKEKGGTGNGTE